MLNLTLITPIIAIHVPAQALFLYHLYKQKTHLARLGLDGFRRFL